jgi:hypothetical protein
MRIVTELILHETGQRVMPAAEINRTHGEHERNDHAARSSPVTISAILPTTI